MPHAPAAEEPRPPATPRIRVNALWNIAGLVGDAALALLILPFTIRTLGDTHYGLWVLIGSLTGAFGLLDLGIRGALGRQLAFHRAERNWDEVNATLNTALGLLGIACLLALLGVSLLQLLFFALFEVSADQVLPVRIALAVAVSVAVISSLAGLAKWINGCVALSIGLSTYAHRVLLPAVLTASVPYLIWRGLSPEPPQTPALLLVQVMGFCLAFAVPFYGLCIRPLKSGLKGWRKKRPRPAEAPSSEPSE